jgi:hypothetical protein
MGYRIADPPARSAEEEELIKLAAAGRQVQHEQAADVRSAALARQVEEKKWALSQDKSRLRALGRRNHPERGFIVVATTVVAITGLGGYLLSQSGLFIAIWVNLLVWLVCLPSFGPSTTALRSSASKCTSVPANPILKFSLMLFVQ